MSMGLYASECTDLVFRPIIHSIVSNSFHCINRKWKSEIDIFQRMINSLILIFSAAVFIDWVATTNNQSHCYGPACLCEYKTILPPQRIWIDRIIVSIRLRPQYTTRTLFCTYCGLYSHHSWASPGVSLTFPFSFLRGLLSVVDCFSVKIYLLLNNFQKSKSWTLLEGFRERLQLDGHFHCVLLLGGRKDSLETWPLPQVPSLCSPKTCRVEIVGSENEGKFLKVQFVMTIHDQIQHVKSSKNDAGRLFFHERFSLNNVSGVLLIELTMTAR